MVGGCVIWLYRMLVSDTSMTRVIVPSMTPRNWSAVLSCIAPSKISAVVYMSWLDVVVISTRYLVSCELTDAHKNAMQINAPRRHVTNYCVDFYIVASSTHSWSSTGCAVCDEVRFSITSLISYWNSLRNLSMATIIVWLITGTILFHSAALMESCWYTHMYSWNISVGLRDSRSLCARPFKHRRRKSMRCRTLFL